MCSFFASKKKMGRAAGIDRVIRLRLRSQFNMLCICSGDSPRPPTPRAIAIARTLLPLSVPSGLSAFGLKPPLMAAATRKRPAPLGTSSCCPGAAAAGKKRTRYEFGSIYNYEKLEVLGEGTYGVVVKARDQRTGETVAVKWIRPDRGGAPDLRAVFREAGCLEACRGHPSIVQMKEVAAADVTGDVFIVMEFVGPSLESRLTRALSGAETREAMRQLLRGAEKLHGSGHGPPRHQAGQHPRRPGRCAEDLRPRDGGAGEARGRAVPGGDRGRAVVPRAGAAGGCPELRPRRRHVGAGVRDDGAPHRRAPVQGRGDGGRHPPQGARPGVRHGVDGPGVPGPAGAVGGRARGPAWPAVPRAREEAHRGGGARPPVVRRGGRAPGPCSLFPAGSERFHQFHQFLVDLLCRFFRTIGKNQPDV
ncbi:putative cyclin-dependent kinase F-2 [Panicum miliaceum]|uniref:[RNA-polymerase]-subunit kinase n=1 Tax=Panicum miliaceum TaxID=4540 RepID=A0A3L6TUR3_PANMI|nr:putative cyclin-dependent kinase F-2 [Panicum miliaceum]